jgi:hypothetical protein
MRSPTNGLGIGEPLKDVCGYGQPGRVALGSTNIRGALGCVNPSVYVGFTAEAAALAFPLPDLHDVLIFTALPQEDDLPANRIGGPHLCLLVGGAHVVDVDPAAPDQPRGFAP